MFAVNPDQRVRIVKIEIAVDAALPDGEMRDGISNRLNAAIESGLVADWRYFGRVRIVPADDCPEEGEVFYLAPIKVDRNQRNIF